MRKPAELQKPLRAGGLRKDMSCLCVVGCSVNERCPIHGGDSHLPTREEFNSLLRGDEGR